MSDAKWCDIGQHAFSAIEEGASNVTVNEQKKDTAGRSFTVTKSLDACSSHSLTKSTTVQAIGAEPVAPQRLPDDVHQRDWSRNNGVYALCGTGAMTDVGLHFTTVVSEITCDDCLARRESR